MENTATQTVDATTKQVISQVITTWQGQNKAVTTFFNKYADDAYLKEVAVGRNRAVYLLGHLTAVNDNLLPLLGLGEKLYPELEAPFLKESDKTVENIPTVAELKKQWETVNTTLNNHFNSVEPNWWLDRHTKVTAEEFALEPHRNRLNVLLSRTNHQSYHLGQLNFLKP